MDQLIDFYEKMVNDHPLLEYIEDPFAKGDVKGVKKFIEKLRESHPNVRVGINSMFNSDIENIREYTQMIQEESEEEEEAEEKVEEAPVEAEVPPVVEDKKEEKKDDKKKGGKKGEVVEVVEEEDPNKKPDPNALKFIPGGIHLSKSSVNTISSLQSIITYSCIMMLGHAWQGGHPALICTAIKGCLSKPAFPETKNNTYRF